METFPFWKNRALKNDRTPLCDLNALYGIYIPDGTSSSAKPYYTHSDSATQGRAKGSHDNLTPHLAKRNKQGPKSKERESCMMVGRPPPRVFCRVKKSRIIAFLTEVHARRIQHARISFLPYRRINTEHSSNRYFCHTLKNSKQIVSINACSL